MTETPGISRRARNARILMMLGGTLVVGAVLAGVIRFSATRRAERNVAALVERIADLSADLSAATPGTDTTALRLEIAERRSYVQRAQYHVDANRRALARAWRWSGWGTLLSAIGTVLMVVGGTALRRTASQIGPQGAAPETSTSEADDGV